MAMLTIPSNENGTVYDPTLNDVIVTAISSSPFGFEDVFLYSHGWSTDADRALVDYDVFSIGLMRRILQEPQKPPLPPRSTLEMGVHWPSEITEDPNSPLNALQLATFFQMEQRADAVGQNLVYSMLRLALQAQHAPNLRFCLLGHSFGCKVICAALQDLQTDIAGGTIVVPPGTTWKVILLEPATDWDNLEESDIYGNVGKIVDLRLLMTKSGLDQCLTKWYPDASRIANFFHGAQPTPALGAQGPTPATVTYFGGAADLSVDVGFAMSAAAAESNPKLVVADLTPVHTARAQSQPPAYDGGICGSHSDIFFDEIYNLVAGFAYS
jgi:hypothetical protein